MKFGKQVKLGGGLHAWRRYTHIFFFFFFGGGGGGGGDFLSFNMVFVFQFTTEHSESKSRTGILSEFMMYPWGISLHIRS